MALPANQKKSRQSLISSIVHLPQSFLIWWTGAKRKDLPEHLRNPYAGLGAMAMVFTLATYGGYSFILISIGSTLGAIPGGILAGYFMWEMDRSILGSLGKDDSERTSGKSNNSSDVLQNIYIDLQIKR